MHNGTMIYDDYMCAICDFEELKKIRDFILEKALSFGFPDQEAQKIALAVDEACSNLIRHAYSFDPDKKICIEIETIQDKFTVKIQDNGSPFNPLDVDQPDMKEYFKKFRRGGLGIHIMRKVMDQITYEAAKNKNDKNILFLTKHLN